MVSTNAKSKAKTILIIVAVVSVLGGGVYLYFSSAGWTYSEGQRAGTVTKFSHKGTWVKTWEGELSMGGIEQGGQRTMWPFSVNEAEDGEGLIKQVQDALTSGRRVTIHYREQRGSQSWKGATNYFVTKVEYAGK